MQNIKIDKCFNLNFLKRESIFILFLILIAFNATETTLGLEEISPPPKATQTEYFKTKGVGFYVDLKNKKVYYSFVAEINKSFSKEVFAEIIFENPANKNAPFIINITILPTDTEIRPPLVSVSNLKKNRDYEIVILVYADSKKTTLITKHIQKIRSSFEDKGIGAISEAINYIYKEDFQKGKEILEFYRSFGENCPFSAQLLGEILDDFNKGVVTKEYIILFLNGFSYYSDKNFDACRAELEKAVKLNKIILMLIFIWPGPYFL
ncbi:MAG: hypothetical protein NC826_00300 [Candidatus Omnitrophica bacterium]|nr:hypothetical protein [Candidatus Omnitrophota bacterium]